jgi:hypothetical protein
MCLIVFVTCESERVCSDGAAALIMSLNVFPN